jgi:hypothetical protein
MDWTKCHFSLEGTATFGVGGLEILQARPGLVLMSELQRGLGCNPAHDFEPNLIEGQDFFSQSAARDETRHAQTTLLASSCTITEAPAAQSVSHPFNPSCPMPVRITPSEFAP